MDPYLLLVFLHVAAASALFAAVGVEVVALQRLRLAATAAQARAWLPSVQRPAGGIGHPAMLVIVGTGIWMMIARWGFEAWMAMALASIVAMVLVAVLVGRAPLTRLVDALGEGARDGSGWPDAVRDARLRVSLWLRVGLLVGVIGLMTLKPGWWGSAVVMVTATALGGGVAVVEPRASGSESDRQSGPATVAK